MPLQIVLPKKWRREKERKSQTKKKRRQKRKRCKGTSPTRRRRVLTVSLRELTLAIEMSDLWKDREKGGQTDK